MATTGLLALIDDIATLLDDVALMSKVAARKTAGVLGDDLALNAEQVSGVRAERELPVVWAVAKGSVKNKIILVPAALLLSAFLPWIITPLLMLGGAYLCFEGFEKITHMLQHGRGSEDQRSSFVDEFANPNFDLVAFEKAKINGAIRTDFILSAEIVVIALGTVQGADLLQQILVVTLIAAVITVGVYGLVAGIVKLDDAGLHLMGTVRADAIGAVVRAIGRSILNACPYLMKALAIVGTAAMFLVGGGILIHGVALAPALLLHPLYEWSVIQAMPSWLADTLINTGIGVIAGGVVLAMVSMAKRLLPACWRKRPE